jgi:hypothetical protein
MFLGRSLNRKKLEKILAGKDSVYLCETRLDCLSSAILSLYWDHPFSSLYVDIEGTPEHTRRNFVRHPFDPFDYVFFIVPRRQIFENDAVRTTRLATFVQARLAEAQIASGGPQVFQAQYLSKIDPAVLKQIEAVLKGSVQDS